MPLHPRHRLNSILTPPDTAHLIMHQHIQAFKTLPYRPAQSARVPSPHLPADHQSPFFSSTTGKRIASAPNAAFFS